MNRFYYWTVVMRCVLCVGLVSAIKITDHDDDDDN